MARRSDIDKETVERDYRAGQLSFSEICAKHSISRSTLSRFIREGGWERDMTAAVRVATRAGIVKETIKQERAVELVTAAAHRDAETIAAGVDVAAAVNVRVVMAHRRSIEKLKNLAGELFDELQAVSGKTTELNALIEAVQAHEPDAIPAVLRFASLANRVSTAEKLTKTFGQLIALERQAFSLDEDGTNKADSSVEDVLRAVHGMG